MAHIYDIGTRAWQPDATEGWVASEVTDKQIAGDKVKLVFTLENGEVRPPEGDDTMLLRDMATDDDSLSRPNPSRRRCWPSRRATTPICLR
jgi:myosin heavy subunit